MSSYYDIDAILTDAQKLPCTFELEVPSLGYLDGNAGGNIKPGSKVDLPLWLGTMLAVSSGGGLIATSQIGLPDILDSSQFGNQPLVSLDFPAPLQQRVINALKADPKTVDLRAQAPHFYSLGARILDLFEDEGVVDVLIDTFKKRAAEIADHAHNPRGALGEGADFLRGLDETERQLFRAAHDGAKAVRAWSTELKKN